MGMKHGWNDIGRAHPKYPEGNLFHCHFVAACLTWTESGSNQGRRGEGPATSRQSQGTTFEE